MNENEAPFENFFDSQDDSAEQAGQRDQTKQAASKPEGKKTRKKRTARKPPVAEPAPAAPPAKKTRKPRSDKQAIAGKTRGVKIDLAVALTAVADLTSDDAKIVSHIAAGLQKVAKKSRGRIIAALGKIFA